MEEVKTFEDVWNQIDLNLEATGLTIFNIDKVYLPEKYYNIFIKEVGNNTKWCGKPVKEYVGRVIYFGIVN